MLTFADMENWSISELEIARNDLREQLRSEMRKRDSIKGEILLLQREIKKLRDEA